MKVNIRMYCHGLGDCFLVRFDNFKVVIDGGIVQVAEERDSRMAEVIKSIAEVTDGKIDLLVITHEHFDHMSSFARDVPRAAWDAITVEQLWLAWTEDPNDDFANSLRKTRKKAASLVAEAAAMLPQQEGLTETLRGLADLSRDKTTKATWMETVQKMVRDRGKSVRYCRPGEVVELGVVSGGVRAIVLGPPHGELIHKSDPSAKNPETYSMPMNSSIGAAFQLGASPESINTIADFLGVNVDETSESDDGGASEYLSKLRQRFGLGLDPRKSDLPFGPKYQIFAEEVFTWKYLEDGQRENHRLKELSEDQRKMLSTYFLPENARRRIDDQRLQTVAWLGLKLDSDTNNTSLALMFQLPNGRTLLFPGDAQVGSWLSWGDQTYSLPIEGNSRSTRNVTIEELLGRVKFYKVGHHGSHNATLRERGLELIPDDLVAMVPVVHEHAVKASWGTNIPLNSIMNRLKEKTGDDCFVRMDIPPGESSAFNAGPTKEGWPRPLYYEWTYEA